MCISTIVAVRGIVRHLVSSTVGGRAERAVHRAYHFWLRRTGRFTLPEDQETLAMLAAIARRARTLIDVGANVGRYACFLQQYSGRESAIYAFEPNRDAYALLRYNLTGPGTHCLPFALGAHDGKAALVVPRDAMGNRISALGRIETDATVVDFEVEVRRLDELVARGVIRPRPPVFLKVDVEGEELAVFRGAVDLLRECSPLIYFECQPEHLDRAGVDANDLWELLDGLGYAVLGMEDTILTAYARPGTPDNYLAVPRAIIDRCAGELTPAAIVSAFETGTTRPP